MTHLSGVWVPAQDPVVFPAAQKQLWIGLTPRDGQNPSGTVRGADVSWRNQLNRTRSVGVSLYLVWLSRTLSGEVANRRSHICMTGSLSSSDARTSWVATSGCHNIPEQCIWHTHTHTRQVHNMPDVLCFPPALKGVHALTRLLWSLILMMGSFFLRSQTMAFPLGFADARMCCTWLFHATTLTSSAG